MSKTRVNSWAEKIANLYNKYLIVQSKNKYFTKPKKQGRSSAYKLRSKDIFIRF